MALLPAPDDEAILREALDVLDMPRLRVGRWLDHLEKFYREHGAERHYGECLSLVGRLRHLLAEKEG